MQPMDDLQQGEEFGLTTEMSRPMKKSAAFAFLAMAAGIVVFQSGQMTGYAATSSAGAVSGAGQAAADSANGVGAQVYKTSCLMCHGEDLKGHPPTFPSLVGVGERLTPEQITAQIHNGKGAMPAFPQLKDDEVAALLRYIGATHAAQAAPVTAPQGPPSAGGHTSRSPQAQAGAGVFQQNCAFCHGRDAGGGETLYAPMCKFLLRRLG